MKYILFNADNMKKKIVNESDLCQVLLELQSKGAIFSLDSDNDIIYSFEDENDGETIEFIVENAKFY